MSKNIDPAMTSLIDAFTNIPPTELDKLIGKKCYAKLPKGASPEWGIDIDVNGETITVARCLGDEYTEDNIIYRLPGDKPQVYNIEQTQKAWGHNEEGKYVFGVIKLRIYKADIHECTGRPISEKEIVLID